MQTTITGTTDTTATETTTDATGNPTFHVDNPDGIPSDELESYIDLVRNMIRRGDLDNGITRVVFLVAENRDFVNAVYLREGRPFDRMRRVRSA